MNYYPTSLNMLFAPNLSQLHYRWLFFIAASIWLPLNDGVSYVGNFMKSIAFVLWKHSMIPVVSPWASKLLTVFAIILYHGWHDFN